jgi:hypothetical protein
LPNETYYGRKFNKRFNDFQKTHEKVKDMKAIEELERIFMVALVDCVNELDTRLKKIEQETAGSRKKRRERTHSRKPS